MPAIIAAQVWTLPVNKSCLLFAWFRFTSWRRPGGVPILPIFVARACEQLTTKEELTASGWAQFFLYQTIYCADVEKPSCEEAVKRAMPMWIQEREM